jgi:hypothetical protein
MRFRQWVVVLFGTFAVGFVACDKRSRPPAVPEASDSLGSGSPPEGRKKTGPPAGAISDTPFLRGTKEVPARLDWYRDFHSRNAGTIHFRVTSTAPFSISVLTDKGFQAAMKKDASKFDKSDVILIVDAKPPLYEQRLAVPPGRLWFLLENQSDSTVTMTLECYDIQ